VTDDPDSVLLTSIGEHYVVDRVIGRGGMATVYLCRDTRDESLVAVKVLRKELGSALIVERFLREIAFASELDHPRIPKVLSSGVIGDLPYYAMTYIDGDLPKRFRDIDSLCGEYEGTVCQCTGQPQNSYRRIVELFGPGVPTPPARRPHRPQGGARPQPLRRPRV